MNMKNTTMMLCTFAVTIAMVLNLTAGAEEAEDDDRELQETGDENKADDGDFSNIKGRTVLIIHLLKPEGESLGFLVDGLRNDNKAKLGIYVKEIQAGGT